MNYSKEAIQIVESAERKLDFSIIEKTALFNQSKVLNAFRDSRLSYRHFAPTSGYGYGDEGRDTLNKVFSDIFRAEDSIVSPYIASGTSAIALMLSSILRPKDTLLSISGKPYETLHKVISGIDMGSLRDYNINYKQINLLKDDYDYKGIAEQIKDIKVILITRSRGYEWRNAQSLDSMSKVIKTIKSLNSDVIVAVDNCYGEFVDVIEPLEIGADIIAGSMIKNPGGGIAPTGGYIAGKRYLIEKISYRMNGIGNEIGSYAYGYQQFFQGLFMAPTCVMNALKSSMLFGRVYYDLGHETLPHPEETEKDIIRSIKFNDKNSLISFIRSIQEISPIDSFVTLEPWAMPGYESDVIMAAGTFIAGASIELSADSPMREPYIAYLQGALTYEHVKLAAIHSVEKYLKEASNS